MAGPAKKGLAILIAPGKPKAAPKGDEGDASSDGELAMEEFIAAVKAGDSVSAWESFKAAKDICESEYSEDDE